MPLFFVSFLPRLLLASEPIVTPYRQSEKLAIGSVDADKKSLPTYGQVDLKVDFHATFDNPFDPEDVSLDAEVRTPTGKVQKIPGFYTRDFQAQLVDGKEVLNPNSPPQWHVRLCLTELGNHVVKVIGKDRHGSVTSETVTLRASETSLDGFIRVSAKNRNWFSFDSGKPYWPLGANACWGGEKGVSAYADWFKKSGDAGCNYSRLWLSPDWTTFALERTGKPEEGKGLGQFDLGNCWRIDEALRLADKNGISLMLTLDSYNILRQKDASPYWDKTPHNRENGGPIRIWTTFWTSEVMDRLYKMKIRYLVARYGANPRVMAWELWNEVDLTQDFQYEPVIAWHRRMGQYLREIDPYKHLVTTSMADPMGKRELQLLPELDYVQTHAYSENIAEAVAYQCSRKSQWGKPHYVGEFGADAEGPRTKDDPLGLQIHDSLWTSLSMGSSGAAMSWWWDNYIDPQNLYPLYRVMADFVKGIDWVREDFQTIDATCDYQSRPTGPQYVDLALENGPTTLKQGPHNLPQTIVIQNGKAGGDLPASGFLHGKQNHPDLHNPLTFKVNLDRPTQFDIEVSEVSGSGGANLTVMLDGDRVLTREFADPDGSNKTETLNQYAGTFGFEIPAGRHTIVVENTGADWVKVGYRFKNFVRKATPPMEIKAILGNDTVIAWLRTEGRSWRRAIVGKTTFPPVAPSVVGLDGLAAGTWKIQVWDTWTGKVRDERLETVGNRGKIRVRVPSFSGDLALKLVRV